MNHDTCWSVFLRNRVCCWVMLTKRKINSLTYNPHCLCLVLHQVKQWGWAVLLLLQELEQFRSSWQKKKCRPHPATLNSVAWRRWRWTASILSFASGSSAAVPAQAQLCGWLLVHPHFSPTGCGAPGSPAAGTLGTLSAGTQDPLDKPTHHPQQPKLLLSPASIKDISGGGRAEELPWRGRRWRGKGGRVVEGCSRGMWRGGCCNIWGARNSSLGGKRQWGGCGRCVMEQGGYSDMKVESEVRRLWGLVGAFCLSYCEHQTVQVHSILQSCTHLQELYDTENLQKYK